MKLTYPLRPNPAEIFLIIRAKVLEEGGSILGDWREGTFSFDGISGNYKCDSADIVITITEKPFYIPFFFIKRKFDENLVKI